MQTNQIDFFKTEKGTKIKYIKRCEMCKHFKIDLITNDFFCIKDFEFVDNNHLCQDFKIDTKIKQAIISKFTRG